MIWINSIEEKIWEMKTVTGCDRLTETTDKVQQILMFLLLLIIIPICQF